MVGNVVTIGREMMVGVTWDVEIEEGEYGRESWCMAYRGRGILLELKDELILKT